MDPSEKGLGLNVRGRTPRSGRAEEEPRGGAAAVSILPMDILLLIFARLTVVDLIRAGAVCVSWRKALKTKGRLFPRTIIPWQIYGVECNFSPISDECYVFVDANAGKTYTFHLPEVRQIYIRQVGRSDDGFLVYEDNPGRLWMFNPITKATAYFPPLPPLRDRDRCAYLRVESTTLVVSTGTGYTVVMQRELNLSAFFADAGNQETWSRVSLILDGVGFHKLQACGQRLCGLFYELYGNDEAYRFFSCDLNDTTDLKVWEFKFSYNPCWCPDDFRGPFPGHRRGECIESCYNSWSTNHYPVALPNGDMFVVCRTFLYPRDGIGIREIIGIMVYRLPADLHGEAEIVSSIGNYALFLDNYGSIVVSTLESPELKPSTIYFDRQQCCLVHEGGKGWNPGENFITFDIPAHLNYPDFYLLWFVPAV